MYNSYEALAEDDYLYAKAAIETGRSIGRFNTVASLCSQSAEKFLKAILEKRCINKDNVVGLMRSHNLRAILNFLVSEGMEFGISEKDVKWLGDFYYDARYPGDNFVMVSEEDAEGCISILESLREDCLRLLQEPVDVEKKVFDLKDMKEFE